MDTSCSAKQDHRAAPPRPSQGDKYLTEQKRWNALVRRDPAADNQFYYAVRSTGVYCRPTCAARLPRRENVAFFGTGAEAEHAGFRPCKRCQPNGPGLQEIYAEAIAKACGLIKSAEVAPKLPVLAKAAGMSSFHFHRVFTRLVGLTPKAFASAQRAERLRAELPRRASVTEAIYGAGYNSNSGFYAQSSALLGMSPTRFRKGGAGANIRYAAGECSLGSVLVAASERGVCAILLGDDPKALASNLQTRFPKAEIIPGGRDFARVVERVIALVERPQTGCDLPLDVRGTAFQQRVWQALGRIPVGQTVSYTELARRLGAPQAVRAVARACAANPLAVAIPCHRARRLDGSLSGYRWGVQRKRALLKREAGGVGVGGRHSWLARPHRAPRSGS